MDVPDATGKTVKAQLEHIYKQTGVKPELLDSDIEISYAEQQFLTMFWKIERTKSSSTVSLADILNWCTAYEIKLSGIEIDYIIDLDQLVAKEVAKRNKHG